MSLFREAYCGGYECLVSWADLLDRINVYPVADADTGTNLRISLAPLRDVHRDKAKLIEQLSFSATGNSGNIAASFFTEFLKTECFTDLAQNAQAGRESAWRSVLNPKPGTMLTVFDSLSESLHNPEITQESAYSLINPTLQKAVLSTVQLLPDLKLACVVDSGALGIFIFMAGFFQILAGKQQVSCPVAQLFQGKLTIANTFETKLTGSYCVDTLINTDQAPAEYGERISKLGESVVLVPGKSQLKIHIHTKNPDTLKGEIASFGKIVQWSAEEIDAGSKSSALAGKTKPAIHIVTDAAGSISRQVAEKLGITLLDSYIITGEESRPESLFGAEEIYSLMRSSVKVTTAQPSTFERYQHYQSLLAEFTTVLYLCVGSAYTGNYETVSNWKKEHDTEGSLKVFDTGAASGKLGCIAMITARYATATSSPEKVLKFAQKVIDTCQEYIFIDQLKYLVAGGRLSKTSGFFGDLLHMKPVISPTRDGAQKVGVVKKQADQVEFALNKLAENLQHDTQGFIMLQYSDNKTWVKDVLRKTIHNLYPEAEITCTPLSLTSGVHMGPGTWAMAFLPDWRNFATC
jgi:DegV family protein with EDD domain